jgi:hypothetical protein
MVTALVSVLTRSCGPQYSPSALDAPVFTNDSVLLENVDLAGFSRIASSSMRSLVVSLLVTLRASFRDRAALQLEILAATRLRLTHADRMLWVWLSKLWNGWRVAIVIVKPETVLA